MSAIKIENLTRTFSVSHTNKPAYETLSETLTRMLKFKKITKDKKSYKEEFIALDNVNIDIKQGDVVGIIGKNGSGKSTLLKVISQVLEPTKGKITIDGKLASLLEVGTGFHPELTGRENIYFNGTILGMSQKEIEEKMDDIIEFSEIERFIDTPVKYYSSGMYVRLAFSVAVHVDPDILIVDEVLSVGDAAFQRKSKKRIRELVKGNKTVLLVSHNLPVIEALCDRAILLDGGKIVKEGEPTEVIDSYLITSNKDGLIEGSEDPEQGKGEIKIKNIQVEGLKSEEVMVLKHDSTIELKVEFLKRPTNKKIMLDFRVIDTTGKWTTSFTFNKPIELRSSSVFLKTPRINLTEGGYLCSLFVYTEDGQLQDYMGNAFSFSLKDPSLRTYTGIRQQLVLNNRLRITR